MVETTGEEIKDYYKELEQVEKKASERIIGLEREAFLKEYAPPTDTTLKYPKDYDPTFVEELKLIAGGERIDFCYQCGTCVGSCPAAAVTSFNPRTIRRMAQLGLREVISRKDLWYCTTCYTCYDRCPRDSKLTEIIAAIRNISTREIGIGIAHKEVARLVATTGMSITVTEKIASLREDLGIKKDFPAKMKVNEAAKELRLMWEQTDFMKIIEGD